MARQRLDQLMYEQGLASSRNQAAALIMAGRVKVDGKIITKAGNATKPIAGIQVAEGPRYVSRAALKLESAAAKLKLNFLGKTVLDVGSSTGGFTDFALQHGANKVYAVDVGTNQLVGKLRSDPRVVVMEKTDIRKIKQLPDKCDIAVVDVSFISLRLVLPALPGLLKPAGQIVAMAKPQFEADKKTASMHKGVIKNDTTRRSILKELELWLKQYFLVIDKADSAVAGAKGNIERFYLLKLIKR